MFIRNFDSLPEDAKYIRETVFVKEQGFQEEFDTTDGSSTHIVVYDNNAPVATGRFYTEDNGHTYYIGRIAVIKEYRGKGIGSEVIRAAEQLIKEKNGKQIILHSQCQAENFYKKQGYTSFGESDFDEGCPHIWMKKEL